jgi:hypothetical protein
LADAIFESAFILKRDIRVVKDYFDLDQKSPKPRRVPSGQPWVAHEGRHLAWLVQQ